MTLESPARRLALCFLFLPVIAGLGAPAQAQEAADAATAALEPSAVVEARTNLNGLDAFIEQVIDEWKVPGLAIAVVDDGEVVLSNGYGYRDMERELPVTPRTLFAIGSITKSFTVALLGMLVDEGELDWDTPVREYLPDFRLYDEYATANMTPRDLVTHRSGLPRHDLMWYGSDFTRREMFERLRHLEPSEPFRYVFQYQNLMFMTAGYLAGQLAGTTWEDLARRRLLDPLGMERSVFSVRELEADDDAALPYVKNDETVRLVPYRNIDEIGPAGSINSSVEEMIRYVRFHIELGKHDEVQLLSEANAREMQTPQITVPGDFEYDELSHGAYGMGLGISYYRGRKVVQHGGGIDGFIALLSFMPRERVGMVILTNLSGENPVPTLVSRRVYDQLLELEPVDWLARLKEQRERAEADRSEDEGEPRVAGTAPSHPLAAYAGTYEHPGYGTLRVEVADTVLRASFHDESVDLHHYHYDVFEGADDPINPVLDETRITFLYDAEGRIDRLAVPFEPRVDDIVFTRVPDESLRSSAFLEPLTGAYALQGSTVTVALRGDTLTLTVPGQPTYELEPVEDLRFDFAELSGYSVEFRKDESGAVVEMTLRQPNGTFVATRQ